MSIGKQSHNHNFQISRLFDILKYQELHYPNPTALNSNDKDKWIPYSIKDIQLNVDNLSAWFLNHGLVKGDKVAIIPKIGRPEWVIIDFACQQLGIVLVPLHPSAQIEELHFILKETEARLCIAPDKATFDVLLSHSTDLIQNLSLYHIESNEKDFFSALNYQEDDQEILEKVSKIKDAIQPDDILTIMYTSGTSGVSKGAILTHKNIVSNVEVMLGLLPLSPQDKVISFLPFSHIFERATCYVYIAVGVSVYFGQNKESFSSDFNSVKPVCCTLVPRILEKMYDYLQEERLRKNIIKKVLVKWAMEIARNYDNNLEYRWLFRLKLFVARFLVLNNWKKALGGEIRNIFVGGAALRPEIGRLFSAAGIRVLEGYGMTETAPLIAFNRIEKGFNKFGTVGIPMEHIQIKIDSSNNDHEGEILVKGPNVFKGYYKRENLNNLVFDEENWFKTGDVGKFIDKKFLVITDRKKDIFKTSAGKYVAPQPLERHFCSSFFIEQCLIIGFQKPFVTALFVPGFSILKKWCEKEGIHWTSPQFMVHNIRVLKKIKEEVNYLNTLIPNHEKVRDFHLCFEEWTVENGEYTPSFKPIRNNLAEKYSREIDKLYSK